jgi:hypothetical protein
MGYMPALVKRGIIMSHASVYAPPPPPEQQPSHELTAESIVAAFNTLPYSVMSDTLDALQTICAERFKKLTARYAEFNTRPQPPLAHEGDERARCMAEEAAKRQPLCHRCQKTKPEHPTQECAAFQNAPATRVAPVAELLKPHPHIGRSSRKPA